MGTPEISTERMPFRPLAKERIARHTSVARRLYDGGAHLKDPDHKSDHAARVLIAALLLADQAKQQGTMVNEEVVIALAILHDIGSNGTDIPDHGARGADMLLTMKPENVDEGTWNKIVTGVRCHNKTPDEIERFFPGALTNELKILKDADALDLVRMGDGRDIAFLTDEARALRRPMQVLWKRSRQYDMGSPFENVLCAAQDIGLLHE